MASQVLSGASNPTYTNNTGQNVRIIINFMRGQSTAPTGPSGGSNLNQPLAYEQSTSGSTGITLSWAGVSVNAPGALAIGRNLAFYFGGGEDLFVAGSGLAVSSNNMVPYEGISQRINNALPTELMLKANESFSAVCGVYNIVIIPELG